MRTIQVPHHAQPLRQLPTPPTGLLNGHLSASPWALKVILARKSPEREPFEGHEGW